MLTPNMPLLYALANSVCFFVAIASVLYGYTEKRPIKEIMVSLLIILFGIWMLIGV